MKNNFWLLVTVLASFFMGACGVNAEKTKQPNFVWIVSEDNSLHYIKHYFSAGVETPNIESLAKDGLTFANAYSNAPVCSVARTTLATGIYVPRIGAQYHRGYAKASLPEGARLFHEYLREAGYYVTNKSKTDYNLKINAKKTWDASSQKASWRNRKDPAQPFFHMETQSMSHENYLHFDQTDYENGVKNTALEDIQLPDYFPDTELFRYTQAFYQQRIQGIDEKVGAMVKRLEQDGLLDDTFIFYFSDHGGVLPRGKGYVYESGVHVPLVVRVPKNYRHLVDGKAGDTVDGTVEFVDFGPTLLKLAGVTIPEHMDGTPFLGEGISREEVDSRDETFSYADRFDEKYDLVRSLKKGRYHYVRHYQPYLPDGLYNRYRYKMLAYQQWRDLYKADKLTHEQRQFFEPKPVEALFDVEQDPHEVNNLAADPRYAAELKDLRERLQAKVKSLPDLGFYPESYLAEQALPHAGKFAVEHKEEIASLVKTADLALLPFNEAKPLLEKALNSKSAMQRFWALTACTSLGSEAISLAPMVKPMLKDASAHVRIRAAEFLGRVGEIDPQPLLAEVVNTTDSHIVATEALNSIVYFNDFYGERYKSDIDQLKPKVTGKGVEARLSYLKAESQTH